MSRDTFALIDESDELPPAVEVRLHLDPMGREKLYLRVHFLIRNADDSIARYWLGDSKQEMTFLVFEQHVRPALRAMAKSLGGAYVERVGKEERDGRLWPVDTSYRERMREKRR